MKYVLSDYFNGSEIGQYPTLAEAKTQAEQLARNVSPDPKPTWEDAEGEWLLGNGAGWCVHITEIGLK